MVTAPVSCSTRIVAYDREVPAESICVVEAREVKVLLYARVYIHVRKLSCPKEPVMNATFWSDTHQSARGKPRPDLPKELVRWGLAALSVLWWVYVCTRIIHIFCHHQYEQKRGLEEAQFAYSRLCGDSDRVRAGEFVKCDEARQLIHRRVFFVHSIELTTAQFLRETAELFVSGIGISIHALGAAACLLLLVSGIAAVNLMRWVGPASVPGFRPGNQELLPLSMRTKHESKEQEDAATAVPQDWYCNARTRTCWPMDAAIKMKKQ